MNRLIPLALMIALTGCVRTVGTVVTAPVRVASWGVDKATTSQSEADRNAGRKLRKQRKKQEREARKAAADSRAARGD